jgi:hypothetical protein
MPLLHGVLPGLRDRNGEPNAIAAVAPLALGQRRPGLRTRAPPHEVTEEPIAKPTLIILIKISLCCPNANLKTKPIK